MRKNNTPRTNLIGSIILNLACVVLLINAIQSQMDDTILVLMGVFTGACIFKTLNSTWRFKRLTGHWPDLRYDSLMRP